MGVDVKVHRSVGLALLTAGLIALAAEARADWTRFKETRPIRGTFQELMVSRT